MPRGANQCNPDDIIGTISGGLKVLRRIGRNPNSKTHEWLYECECLACGNKTITSRLVLLKGNKKSCGCLDPNKPNDLVGQKFNHFTVIRRGPDRIRKNGKHDVMWECECDCPKHTHVLVTARDLREGRIKSCGCARYDHLYKHGESGTRLYGLWGAVKTRSTNPNIKSAKFYTGKGITVCDEWKNDYIAFRDWALDEGYDKNAPYGQFTIERINNNDGYSPENCKLVDLKAQANHKTNNRYLTYMGITKTASEWAELIGISQDTMYDRLSRCDDLDKVFKELFDPSVRSNVLNTVGYQDFIVENDGVAMYSEQWDIALQFPIGTIRNRIVNMAMSNKEAVTTPIKPNIPVPGMIEYDKFGNVLQTPGNFIIKDKEDNEKQN